MTMYRLPKLPPAQLRRFSISSTLNFKPKLIHNSSNLQLKIRQISTTLISSTNWTPKVDHIPSFPRLKTRQLCTSSIADKDVWLRLKKNPILSTPSLNNRQLSTNSVAKNQCWPKPDYGPVEVRRTALLNGITVAAAKPLGAVIASCTVMFQAGSRFECDESLGATHFIRACSTASGCGYSAYSKMRVPQQHGVAVTCSTDRQTVAFTMRCPLTSFINMKYYLQDIAARCCFNEWEVDDRRHIVRDDLVRLHPRDRVMDLIQVASWTGSLANSMYCAEGRIDSMDENALNCFAYTHYKTDETTVASVGIPFEETIKLAEMLEFRRDRPAPRYIASSCPRAGFEYYDLGPKAETWIAVAVPGCGTCADLDCLVKHAIIAEACGTDDVASGQHHMDRTPMPPLCAMAGTDIYTQYRAFNISYRETGLFGILVRTRSCSAWQATLAASQFLTQVGDLNRKQIEIGRARLKLRLALHEEDCVKTSENLALQLSNNVTMDTARDAMAIIDSINIEEICCTAQILSTKSCLMSLAVVGDIGAVPHDMELLRCR